MSKEYDFIFLKEGMATNAVKSVGKDIYNKMSYRFQLIKQKIKNLYDNIILKVVHSCTKILDLIKMKYLNDKVYRVNKGNSSNSKFTATIPYKNNTGSSFYSIAIKYINTLSGNLTNNDQSTEEINSSIKEEFSRKIEDLQKSKDVTLDIKENGNSICDLANKEFEDIKKIQNTRRYFNSILNSGLNAMRKLQDKNDQHRDAVESTKAAAKASATCLFIVNTSLSILRKRFSAYCRAFSISNSQNNNYENNSNSNKVVKSNKKELRK